MTALACADHGGKPHLNAWLDRLASLARPLAGGTTNRSGGVGKGPASVGAELRDAQRLALAGQLAIGLVHDFNNALMVVGACLETIGEAPDDIGIVRDQADAAAKVIHGASELARRLATFGRPDNGSRKPADLNEIVRSSAQLATLVARPLVEISVCCQGHALPVDVDALQIEQAILNLCLNARDAMPDGGTLHLTTRSAIRWTAQDGDGRGRAPVTYAVVEVSDTGTGIPRHLQSQIFEPFFTTKPAGKGSGLGLSMVRETALAHQGLVELTSDALGTAFRILLPLS